MNDSEAGAIIWLNNAQMAHLTPSVPSRTESCRLTTRMCRAEECASTSMGLRWRHASAAYAQTRRSTTVGSADNHDHSRFGQTGKTANALAQINPQNLNTYEILLAPPVPAMIAEDWWEGSSSHEVPATTPRSHGPIPRCPNDTGVNFNAV